MRRGVNRTEAWTALRLSSVRTARNTTAFPASPAHAAANSLARMTPGDAYAPQMASDRPESTACGDDPNLLGASARAQSDSSAPPAGDAGAPTYVLGADVSSVQQAAAAGASYVDDDGTRNAILWM